MPTSHPQRIAVIIAAAIGTNATAQDSSVKAGLPPLGTQTEAKQFTSKPPGAVQFDFISRINGQAYRIMVSPPPNAEPAKTYPVFYVLDGNYNFSTASDHAVWRTSTPRFPLQAAFIVGVGYPTDDILAAGEQRIREFALRQEVVPPNRVLIAERMDKFVRALLEEVKPFVASRFKIDREAQSIYGHSLTGGIVMRLLYHHPDSFQTFIAADPAMPERSTELRSVVDEFVTSAKSRDLRLRVLLLFSERDRSETVKKLAEIPPSKMTFATAVFPEENHVSMGPAAIGRALSFTLNAPAKSAKE